MIKILYLTGEEEKLDGKIHLYGNYLYDVIIEEKKSNNFSNLKLIYDDNSEEIIYFNLYSYGFYKGKKEYKRLYKKSKREITMINNFKKLIIDNTDENLDMNNTNALSEWLIFCEQEIKDIYNK